MTSQHDYASSLPSAPDKRLLLAAKLSQCAGAGSGTGPGTGSGPGMSQAQQLLLQTRATERSLDDVHASNILRLGERYTGGELGGGNKNKQQKGGGGGGGAQARTGADEDDDGDVSNSLKMFARPEEALTPAELAKRAQQQAEAAQRRLQLAVQSCPYCQWAAAAAGGSGGGHSQQQQQHHHQQQHHQQQQQQQQQQRELVVHSGAHTVLALLPLEQQLVPGHSVIFPIVHTPSVLAALSQGGGDDDLAAELAAVKARLRRTHSLGTGSACVFIETAAASGSGGGSGSRSHGRIECVPVPRDALSEAVIMFKESLQDCNGLFAQHGRLIELTKERPLSRAIPASFTYLHVELDWVGADGQQRTGLAMVVDEAAAGVSGSRNIGCLLSDVLAGLLDEEPLAMRRKVTRGHAQAKEEREAAAALRRSWDLAQ